jgi:hypothetical protein
VILLDQNLNSREIIQAVSAWSYEKVTSVPLLTGQTQLSDEQVIKVLHELRHTTFVTVNVKHFWRVAEGHPNYAIFCFNEDQDLTVPRIPQELRKILRLPQFHRVRQRCRYVVKVTTVNIQYYRRLCDKPAKMPYPR